MKHHQLRALIAVARAGSVHEAARTLHVTQPAVTRALRELEAHVGLSLCLRSASGVTLTAEGELLLQRAELIVQEFARADAEMARIRDGRGGRLAVGVAPLAGLAMLPQAYDRFRRAMPNVGVEFIEFSAAQLVEQLKKGALDFAIGASSDVREFAAVRCTHLASYPMWFAASCTGALAGARSLADLQQAEWLHTEPSTEFRTLLSNAYGAAGLVPPSRITRCASPSLYYSLATGRNVVTSWSQLTLHASAVIGTLKPLDLGLRPLPRQLFLLLRDGMVTTKPAAYFLRCIDDAVKDEASAACGSAAVPARA